jgi:adenylate kinase
MQGQRNIVLLLGAPGAGKGTQARFLSETLGVPHVASGDLLREHRRQGTELGRAAQTYMDRGDLVPDQLVIDMILQRLEQPDARRGALLDGFPRTRAQAEALDRSLAERHSAVRRAMYLDVPKATLVERLGGRWMCGTCQATYHEHFSPPTVPGRCDVCGGELYQRPDDRNDVVENRVEVYLRETVPVIDYYREHGLLRAVDGVGSIDEVRARLAAALGGAVRGQRRDRWHLYVEPGLEGAAPERWQGRTLCGKYVPRDGNRELSTVDAFLGNACRECRSILRARQGPRAEAPTEDEALASSG